MANIKVLFIAFVMALSSTATAFPPSFRRGPSQDGLVKSKIAACAGLLRKDAMVSIDVLEFDAEAFVRSLLTSRNFGDADATLIAEQAGLVQALIEKPVASYFGEQFQKNVHYFGGHVTEVAGFNDVTYYAFANDVREIFLQIKKMGARLKSSREIEPEEDIYFSLAKEISSFLKEEPKWLETKSSSLYHLYSRDPEITLGEYAHFMMLDYILEKSPLVDQEALAQGEVRFIQNHPKLVAARKFWQKRVKNTYANKVALWGPIGLVILALKYFGVF